MIDTSMIHLLTEKEYIRYKNERKKYAFSILTAPAWAPVTSCGLTPQVASKVLPKM